MLEPKRKEQGCQVFETYRACVVGGWWGRADGWVAGRAGPGGGGVEGLVGPGGGLGGGPGGLV